MEIKLGTASTLILEHNGETTFCGKFAHNASGLFEEINAFWQSLSSDEADDLFELYKEINEVIVAGEEVTADYFRSLLDDIHTEEAISPFCSKLVYPKNATDEYIEHKHYTPEETYTRPDYLGLGILSIRLRSLMPVLAGMELYVQHRSNSGGGIMYKTKGVIDKIADCEIFYCDAFERLKVYVHATQSKMLNGQKDVNITGSIVEAFGTEDLPVYLLGTSVILGCIPTSINNPKTNVAKSINSKLRDELTKKITRRFNVVNERPFAKMALMEDNNVGYFETYQAREQVPGSIPLIMGVWAENYRKARKSFDVDLAPAEIKEFINSLELNPYPQFTVFQQFIVKMGGMGIILHPTVTDIPATMLISFIGILQSYLIEHKFFELARLMSSHGDLITRDRRDIMFSNLSFKNLDADTTEWLDRFYTAKITNPRGSGWVKGYDVSLNLMIDDVKRYTWRQCATSQVCQLLGTENGMFTPSENLRIELGRFIATVNARAVKSARDKTLLEG